MTSMDRRQFLKGVLIITASAAIPAGIARAALPVIYGDGERDDTAGINALLAGEPFRTYDGFEGVATKGWLTEGSFLVTNTLHLRGVGITVCGCNFKLREDLKIDERFVVHVTADRCLVVDCIFSGGQADSGLAYKIGAW